MYNIRIQMPDVPWSSVPGPRSRGFDVPGRLFKCKDKEPEEQMLLIRDSLVTQLQTTCPLPGAYVIILQDGQELEKVKINVS